MTNKRLCHCTAHEQTIVSLYRALLKNNPGDDLQMNSIYRKKRQSVPNTNIFPDVLNLTQLIACEVHWAGQRKESAFERLPREWSGVNVIITDIWQTDNAYIFTLDGKYAHITGEQWTDANENEMEPVT